MLGGLIFDTLFIVCTYILALPDTHGNLCVAEVKLQPTKEQGVPNLDFKRNFLLVGEMLQRCCSSSRTGCTWSEGGEEMAAGRTCHCG